MVFDCFSNVSLLIVSICGHMNLNKTLLVDTITMFVQEIIHVLAVSLDTVYRFILRTIASSRLT